MIGVLASGKTSVLAGQFITQNFPVLGFWLWPQT